MNYEEKIKLLEELINNQNHVYLTTDKNSYLDDYLKEFNKLVLLMEILDDIKDYKTLLNND